MAYTYEGVKFRVEMLGNETPDDPRVVQLMRWCRLFDENGLAPHYDGGSYGNLGFRPLPGKRPFIITAAHSGLGASDTNDRFVTVEDIDLERGIVYARGARQPSSESMIHHAIYTTRPDVNAVFHGHCEAISRNAARAGIPVTRTEEPYGTLTLVTRVMEVLENEPSEYLLEMRNHGFIAMGRTLDETGQRTLEALARCRALDRQSRYSTPDMH